MADTEMRAWALKGAEQRLLEIAQEAKVIYATFPELRAGGDVGTGARRPGRPRKEETPHEAQVPQKRRRRTMSKEARRKISEAQKARWAKQKGAAPQGGAAKATDKTAFVKSSRKKK